MARTNALNEHCKLISSLARCAWPPYVAYIGDIATSECHALMMATRTKIKVGPRFIHIRLFIFGREPVFQTVVVNGYDAIPTAVAWKGLTSEINDDSKHSAFIVSCMAGAERDRPQCWDRSAETIPPIVNFGLVLHMCDRGAGNRAIYRELAALRPFYDERSRIVLLDAKQPDAVGAHKQLLANGWVGVSLEPGGRAVIYERG